MNPIANLARTSAWLAGTSTPWRSDVGAARSGGGPASRSDFCRMAGAGEPAISADPPPAARGLGVQQHAERVLALLCGAHGAAD